MIEQQSQSLHVSSSPEIEAVLRDADRLAAVRATGLLDSEIEAAFDRLTQLAVELVGVAASFISLVDESRDFYKSACGFGEPLATARHLEGPTFCHYTVALAEPLVIPDTRADERYRHLPTVESLGVAAYVGIPLLFNGQVIGAFCAIDTKPRDWSARDVHVLTELAQLTLSEIELRAANRRHEASLGKLTEAYGTLELQRMQLELANSQLESQQVELELANQQLMDTGSELEMQAEELAEQSEQSRAEHARLDTILSSISDAFFALDEQWRFTYVNNRAEQVLLRPRGELLGRSIWEEFAPAVGSNFDIQYRRAVETANAVVFEEFYAPLETWFEVRAYPGPDGLAVYFQDVNLRHAADAERAASLRRAVAAENTAIMANAAKSEFLATMSHELRTPLNAILGYTNLMELEISGRITPDQRQHLGRLRASGEHLLALVNDVLDLSKLEAGEMVLDSDVANAGDAISATLTLASNAAEARDIQLIRASSGGAEPTYVGDEMRVRQILINLVTNAVKFTQPGGQVSISCAVRAVDDGVDLTGDGPWCAIEVVDTGIGIAPEHQAAVFQPFKQVVGGHTRQQGGTGLGLAISRRLARQMGGDVVLVSNVGSGSTFTLWLPSAGLRGGVEETGSQRSARARRHAPDHRVRGLSEIGKGLRNDVEHILDAIVTRMRAAPAFTRTAGLTQALLEDHTLSFLTNAIQSLTIVDQTGSFDTDLMNDGAKIQVYVAKMHGAQRRRMGWTEEMLAEEYRYIDAELASRVRHMDVLGSEETTLAIGILARLVEAAAAASVSGFREATSAG
ncbi:MAG: ATP-binding protein [Gemmatimonadota bacterium]|nr:ATP-binding protein [Gemmatimonadota bacterium]